LKVASRREEVLQGGVANAGAVVRSGANVLRPSNQYSASILRFLSRLEGAGFRGAPSPVGLEPDGRERLRFIPGEVALPPYPDWAQTDETLQSIAELMREMHAGSQHIEREGLTWNPELADPAGGPVICHNDICLENVVFRNGSAVALLDFDFAAPGRPSFDVAAFARMCVPVDDDANSARLGWRPADRPRRLRLACDAYGLASSEREEVFECLSTSITRGQDFVQRHAEAGEPGFVRMWAEMGGSERYYRRQGWWSGARASFAAALA
jgi:aminoglycoside phosphotransferase (APT) family kinase protein